MQSSPQHLSCYQRKGLSLRPPPGFIVSERFGGFVDETTGDSIFTMTQRISIEAQKALNTGTALAKNGIEITSRQNVSFGPLEGEIIGICQLGSIEKLVVILGNGKRSALVMATTQGEWDTDRRKAMRESLLSVVYEPPAGE